MPCGAFGNLFAGFVAKRVGLPVARLVAATTPTAPCTTSLATGVWRRRPLINTVSSAIDIVVPYNFWRMTYYALGEDAAALSAMQDEYVARGEARIPKAAALDFLREIFLSDSVGDDATLATIGTFYGSSARPPDGSLPDVPAHVGGGCGCGAGACA